MLSHRLIAPAMGTIIMLSVGFLGEYGFKLEKSRILNDQRSKVTDSVGRLRSRLESQLNATLYLTDGLIAYVKSHPHLEPDRVQSMLKNLYEQGRHIRNIGLAPGNRLSYVYPQEGNEQAIGLYYPDLPDQWPAVQRTIDQRIPVLAGPVQLKQGGIGLVYRVPVFTGNNNMYWGLLSMVVDDQSLFSEIGINPQTSGLQLALRGKNGTGAQGDVFKGDASLFSDDSVKATISLPGGTWQLAAIPAEGWNTGENIYWIRIAGWIAGLLVGVLLYIALASASRRLQAEASLKSSRDELNEAQRVAMIGSWVLDLRTNRLAWSDETYHIFEVDPQTSSPLYDAFLSAIHPEDREMVERAYDNSLTTRKSYDIVHRLLFTDGRIKHVRERCETLYDQEGNPTLSRGTVQDVTRLQEAENALRESEQRWKFALEGSGHGVWDWNIQTGEIYLSRQEMTVLGYDGDDATYTHIDELISKQHPDDISRRTKALEQCFSGETPLFIYECRTRARDGQWIWILARGLLVSRTPGGLPLRMIGTHTDITEQKQAEKELERLANSDPLTGVPNRRYFIKAVESEMLRITRSGRAAALLMMDIDYFKHVNDKYGHAVGDAALKHITGLCQGFLRRTDHFGRLGGEEFAFLLPETDNDGARRFASRLRQIIDATPMRSASGDISITVSIGVAMLLDTGASGVADVMNRADMALYRAKESGRNRVEFAEAEHDRKNLAS